MHHPILAMAQAKKKLIPQKIKHLQERAWSVWTDIHKFVNDCGHDDKVFCRGLPIKSPTIEICDNLDGIGKWLETNKVPDAKP